MSVEHDILYRAFLRRLKGVCKGTPTAIVTAEWVKNQCISVEHAAWPGIGTGLCNYQSVAWPDLPSWQGCRSGHQRHRRLCWAGQAATLLSLNLTVQCQLSDITTASLVQCQQEQYTSEPTSSPLTKIKEFMAIQGSDCFTHAQNCFVPASSGLREWMVLKDSSGGRRRCYLCTLTGFVR